MWREEQGDTEMERGGFLDEEIEGKIERIGRIQWQVLRLWIAFLNQPLHDDEPKSVAVWFVRL